MRSIILSTEPIEAIREAWAKLEEGETLRIDAPHRVHNEDLTMAWLPWYGRYHFTDGKTTRCMWVDVAQAIGSTDYITDIKIRETISITVAKPIFVTTSPCDKI